MNTSKWNLFLIPAVFTVLTLLAGCFNLLDSVNSNDNTPQVSPETGRLMVRIGDGEPFAARTLIPLAPDFTLYTLEFVSGSNTLAKEITALDDINNLKGSGYGVDLEPGNWTLTVTASIGTAPAYTEAAKSAPVTVTITAETIPILPPVSLVSVIDSTRAGTFAWDITLPSGLPDTAALELTKIDAPIGAAIPSVDLLTKREGTADIPAGYYDVRIHLTKDGKEAGRTQVAHIYPGLTTKAEFVFTGAAFVSMKYLKGILVVTDSAGTTTGSFFLAAYRDAAFTVPIPDSAGNGVRCQIDSSGSWKMKIPVDEAQVYFKLEGTLLSGGFDYGLPAGSEGSLTVPIPKEGKDGIVLSPITIAPMVAYRAAGGGNFYTSLQAAIDASAGTAVTPDTITLLADVPIDGTPANPLITIPNGKHVELVSGGAIRTISRAADGLDSLITVGETTPGSASLTLGGDTPLIIDGNKAAYTALGALITVNTGRTLTISGSGVKIKDNKEAPAATGTSTIGHGGVNVEGGSFTMSAGSIEGNELQLDNNGAGVHVSANGTFTMSGTAVITGNKTPLGGGGGVYVRSSPSSDFYFNGGTIDSNESQLGGGVYVAGDMSGGSVFTMSGTAEIAGNTAAVDGGGVYVAGDMSGGGVFTMDSGFITSNTATGTGGGVYVSSPGILPNAGFVMTGGIIGGSTPDEKNTAGGGGGVFVSSASASGAFTMSGNAQIIGNEATGDSGGGVGVGTSPATFTMSGNAQITGNKAIDGSLSSITDTGGHGGGVSSSGDFTMMGNALISGNTVGTGLGTGAGVFVISNNFYMQDNARVAVGNKVFVNIAGTISLTLSGLLETYPPGEQYVANIEPNSPTTNPILREATPGSIATDYGRFLVNDLPGKISATGYYIP